MSYVDQDWKAVYHEIRMLNWVVLLVFSVVSALFFEGPITMGVILGGLTIISNFGVLQFLMRRAFDVEGARTRFHWIVGPLSILRFLALILVLFVLIGWKMVDPIGLTVGVLTLFVSIVAFGIIMAYRIYVTEST